MLRLINCWLCLLLAMLIACPVSAADIPVVDADGQSLVLDGPAQRIVSLSPHITEQLFAIGAGERIVATVEWSDYPAAAQNILRLGSSSTINYEVLLRLRPDLVIVWRSGNGEQVVARLKALGLKVYVQEPRSIADIPVELARLGQLTGQRAEADAVINDFNGRIKRLRDTYSQRQKVRVFQQIWNQPMISLNGEHLVSDIIRLCGGENIFADAPALVVNTSLEMVVLKDPQVIVISESDGNPPEWASDWQRWPDISAVANQQVYVINPDLLHRHGPRIAEGAEQMCSYIDKARDRQGPG
ncbi:MAG: hypothetical protein VR73_07930 [Gammaproteobacteria bacterium BRH_c0]|nr:MAG: hypothetical protein VR73_07930 [Gammaproteobacteria bacterium BRH_c0]